MWNKLFKIDVATGGTVYFVFILPVIFSIIFGCLVMSEVLKEPERELDIWQLKSSDSNDVSSDSVKILGLESEYSTNSEIKIQVTMDDRIFDCGDLYITINNIDQIQKKVVTQSGFFGQCFDRNNSILPVDDKFSEIIETPGNYEVLIEIVDKHNKKTISSSAEFTVK